MKEKNINERKAKALTVIAVIFLLIIVIGAAYAYFRAQIGNGTNTSINATTGTTDVLTFSMQDLNAANGKENVTDENSDEDIIINANADNFGKKEDILDNSLADGVKAVANLKANDATNTASAKYDVYFVIENNELIYTQDGNTPELLLNVKMPNGKEELTTIKDLQYYADTNGFSGFDITNKENIAIPIYKGYEIEVTEGGEITQDWDITVTLINLNADQNKNTGKKLEGKVLLTKELPERADLKLAHISSLSNTTITTDSITTTLNFDEEGTYDIEEYYYGYKEIGVTKTRTIDEEGITWSEPESSETHTFSGLNNNSQYEIYAYTVDSEGFKSNRYETQITVSEGKLPEIEKVEVTNKSYDSISVTVTPKTDESVTITNYEYQIKTNGEVITDKTITDNSTTHEFNDLKELTEYEIIVKAISSEKESIEYKLKVTTYIKACNEGESIEVCLTRIDKKQNPEKSALLFHNELLLNGANDNSYRYSGGNDKVHNYVCLDNNIIDGCDDINDLYRIIGLFKNDTTQNYEIKLIKSDYTTKEMLGEEGSYYGQYNYANVNYRGFMKIADIAGSYWTSSDNQVNLWKDSALNNINLNQNFLTYLSQRKTDILSKIPKHVWITGGNIYHNLVSKSVKVAYPNEINNPSVGQYASDLDKFWEAQIGLMYISDYGYAAYENAWNTLLFDVNNNQDYTQNEIINNNWMYMGLPEWTITRRADLSTHAIYVDYNGRVSSNTLVHLAGFTVRPSFYLDSTVKIWAGNGTKEKPYRLYVE